MPITRSLEEEYFARTMGGAYNIPSDNVIRGKCFCFTGKLEAFTRDTARSYVEAAGGRWSSSVTAGVHILVAGSIPRTAIISGTLSLKLAKARRTGKEVISEETFLQMLKDAQVYR